MTKHDLMRLLGCDLRYMCSHLTTQKQRKETATPTFLKVIALPNNFLSILCRSIPLYHSWVPEDLLLDTKHGQRRRWLAPFILGCDRSNVFDNFGHFTPPSLGSFACQKVCAMPAVQVHSKNIPLRMSQD